MGGWSSERAISLKSGNAVLAALQQRGINAHAIDVQRDTVLQQLAQGDLNIGIDVTTSDEVGQLQRATKLMIETLRGFAYG